MDQRMVIMFGKEGQLDSEDGINSWYFMVASVTQSQPLPNVRLTIPSCQHIHGSMSGSATKSFI